MRSRLARLGAAALLVAAVAPATAHGQSAPILLPSVRTSLTPGPPLPGANAPTEVLFPPGLTSDERVLVGIDTSGNVISIAVVQRLGLHELGDYSFTVPGPISDVEAAPGSDAEPGLRRDAILWAGFSAGKKTLAARATLRVAPSAAVLPLEVTVERDGNAAVVHGRNTSAAPGPVLIGSVSVRDVTKAFEETRRGLRLGRAAPDVYVGTSDVPISQSQPIAAPLDVRGEFGGAHFKYRLGDGGPMEFSFRAPHAAPNAKLRLVITPVAPSRLLKPPGAATWAEAVRRGRLDPSQLLERVSQARLTLARAFQYQMFLANPNPSGVSTGVYIYETAKRSAAPPPKVNDEHRGSGAWRALVYAAIAILSAGAAVVLWAHS
jgi:hypothetical protein